MMKIDCPRVRFDRKRYWSDLQLLAVSLVGKDLSTYNKLVSAAVIMGVIDASTAQM